MHDPDDMRDAEIFDSILASQEDQSGHYTPTTDEVRFRYTEYPYVAQLKDDPADPAEFNRWLAEHDAATRTEGYSSGYGAANTEQRQAGNGRGIL